MKVVALNEERKESPEHHVRVCISTPHPTNPYDSLCVVLSPHFMPPLEAFRIANNAIAEALNAPVKATQEVLAGLPQGSDFLAHKVGYSPIWQSAFYCPKSQWWWSEDEPLDESYIIKSDGCSKTLQVLLQFTLDGVRIKEGV
jgi:hypothetical protein